MLTSRLRALEVKEASLSRDVTALIAAALISEAQQATRFNMHLQNIWRGCYPCYDSEIMS